MSPPEIVTLRAAARHANVSHHTVKGWCVRYGIGRLVDGRWRIERAALNRIVRARSVLYRGGQDAAE